MAHTPYTNFRETAAMDSDTAHHLREAGKLGSATVGLISVAQATPENLFFFYPSIETIRGFARLAATEARLFLTAEGKENV